jgi:hypothetical protein
LAPALGLLILVASAGHGSAPAMAQPARLGQPAPALDGGPWINSAPLRPAAFRGRVLLVEFWTYG